MSDTFHIVIHLVFTIALWDGYCYYPCIIYGDLELRNLSGLSQISYLICSEADLNLDNLIAEPTSLLPPWLSVRYLFHFYALLPFAFSSPFFMPWYPPYHRDYGAWTPDPYSFSEMPYTLWLLLDSQWHANWPCFTFTLAIFSKPKADKNIRFVQEL